MKTGTEEVHMISVWKLEMKYSLSNIKCKPCILSRQQIIFSFNNISMFY